jgi:hypothetical protein
MKEFTGTLTLTIEVTIEAKNKKEATLFFDDLYLNITIENDGNQVIEIVGDNLGLIENSWELQD